VGRLMPPPRRRGNERVELKFRSICQETGPSQRDYGRDLVGEDDGQRVSHRSAVELVDLIKRRPTRSGVAQSNQPPPTSRARSLYCAVTPNQKDGSAPASPKLSGTVRCGRWSKARGRSCRSPAVRSSTVTSHRRRPRAIPGGSTPRRQPVEDCLLDHDQPSVLSSQKSGRASSRSIQGAEMASIQSEDVV